MTQKKAIYDNGVSGFLPMASVVRDTAKDNIVDGGQYAINAPSYGHQSARCGFNEWVQTVSANLTWNYPATGYDADGVTRLACAYRTTGQLLCFWLDTDINGAIADGGTPVLEFSLLRLNSQTVNEGTPAGGALVDIMQGASTEAGDVLHSESDVALRPRGAICLPGCFLFLCERTRNTTGIIWKTEGIGVVAMQHDGRGGFSRKWLGDLQTDYLADPFFSGWMRGREWWLTSYFPFTLQQSPCLRAFIPIVDYIIDNGHVGDEKKGGQLGIFEATRTDINAEWDFGDIFKIPFEKEEDGVHFHTAAWTPRGVVLAMGDGNTLNENVLCTCSDWDDYTESSNWTIVRRAYGSGEYGTDPEHGYTNQWGGCVPHPTDINKVLVGGDNVSAVAYVMEVLEDETLEFQPLWGYLDGNDSQGKVTLGFSSAGPENTNKWLTRNTPQANSETLHAALIYGVDEIAVAVAKTPSTGTASNRFAMHGDDIYSFGLSGSGASIHKMAPPTLTSQRGLAVGPGGLNLLELDGTDYRSDVAFPTCVISTVIDATAPGSNPVLEVVGLSSTADTRLFRINVAASTYAFTANSVYIVLWVKNLDKTGIPVRMVYIDNGIGTDITYSGNGYYTGVKVDDWHQVVFTIENGATPWANPHVATLTFSHGIVVGHSHWRLQMQGVYPGPQCPYLIDIETTSTNEEVEQRLTALGANWTVGIELHIPMGGEDYELPTHPTSIMDTVALATVYVDANNYVEITADLENDEIDFLAVVGGTPEISQAVSFVALQRDCTIQLAVTFDGTTLDFYAACGGLDERGLQTASVTAELVGTPVSVRIGDNDFTQVPNTELFMVAIDDAVALDATGVLALLASDAEVGSSTLTIPTIVNAPDDDVFYSESPTDPATTHTAFVVAAGMSLVVVVATRDQINDSAAPVSLTYGGESMTLVATHEENHPAAYVYVLTEPLVTVGDIVISWADSQIGYTVVPVVIFNLDKTNPVDNVTSNGFGSLTSTHTVGPLDVVKGVLVLEQVCFVLSAIEITPPTGMTEVANFQDPVGGSGAMGTWLGSLPSIDGGVIPVQTLTTSGTRRSAIILISLNGVVADDGISSGGDYAAMSHFNLVTPKII